MHRLHLLRHAKSSWEEGLDDRERPLNRRGREAARRLGQELPAMLGEIDLVLCSSAVRTRQTASLVLAGYAPTPRVLFEDGLYLAPSSLLLRRLEQLDEAAGAVLVIGHNPGLHDLAVALAAPDSPASRGLAGSKFPTLARASFAIAAPWSALRDGQHQLIEYATPKST